MVADVSAHRLAILRDRVDAVRAWARSRIDHCRDVEARSDVRSRPYDDAWTERRALEAVLRMLEGEGRG